MGDEKLYAGMTRRSMLLGTGGAVVLLALGGLKAVPANAQVRPPGGQDEDRLESACIRCQRCVEACPRNALRPAHMEDGILGVRLPAQNFNEGWCDFCQEENDGSPLCTASCPTGALTLPEGANHLNTIIGVAEITHNWCLAWSKDNGCRFCVDACPYGAIELDSNKHPVVYSEKCTGCGACQNVCVSLQAGSLTSGATARAIVVQPLAG